MDVAYSVHERGLMDTISAHGLPAERRRKSYSEEDKRRIVVESYEPGASVSVVA